MFEPIKTILIFNKKSHDINGNPVFNCDVEVNGELQNEAFVQLTAQGKTLKNGTLNIKDYQFRIEELVKEIAQEKFGSKEFEVVEGYHK